MYYTLRRCGIEKIGFHSILTLDLWNEKYNAGYELRLTILTKNCKSCFSFAREYLGDTLKIETWDYLTRVIKECDK